MVKDVYLKIQDELDYAIEQKDKLWKKKGKIREEAYMYWDGKVTGFQKALEYLEEYLDKAYSRSRRVK